MRLSLRAKQTAGVTALIALSMTALSAQHVANLARVGLEDSRGNGELLGRIIYQRAREAIGDQGDPRLALRDDLGIRSILESTAAYGRNVTYAAIVDTNDIAIAHSFRNLEDMPLPRQESLSSLLQQGTINQLRAIYVDQPLEIILPLNLGESPFGAIRIGLSPVLIRHDLALALEPMLWTTLLISGSALMIGLVLARRIVRPIHVISSGLMRLRKGEKGVTIDLSQDEDEELKGLGESFSAIGEQLAAHSKVDALGRVETLVEELEEAVAILNPQGDLLFANSAMRATFPATSENDDTGSFFQRFPGNHPYRRLVAEAIKTRRDQGPVTVSVPGVDDVEQERLITVHFIESSEQGSLGVMLVARNVTYLGHVRSTIEYARKLASLGRLMAGLTHEVKNPLNAMTIHLELVRQHLLSAAQERETTSEVWSPRARAGSVLGIAAAGDSSTTVLSPATDETDPHEPALSRRGIAGAREHVEVIAGEIKRLDEVIQGFLRFIRPQELQLQMVDVQILIREVLALVEPEVRRNGVTIRTNQHDSLPELRADPALLRQALLNLALNGCQAMPNGGELTVTAAVLRDGRMRLTVEDTGAGIPANQLSRIFDLYYTTKPGGSGIGLSMVFRIAQIHGGEIEVESVEGRGTSFRILLPRI